MTNTASSNSPAPTLCRRQRLTPRRNPSTPHTGTKHGITDTHGENLTVLLLPEIYENIRGRSKPRTGSDNNDNQGNQNEIMTVAERAKTTHKCLESKTETLAETALGGTSPDNSPLLATSHLSNS